MDFAVATDTPNVWYIGKSSGTIATNISNLYYLYTEEFGSDGFGVWGKLIAGESRLIDIVETQEEADELVVKLVKLITGQTEDRSPNEGRKLEA